MVMTVDLGTGIGLYTAVVKGREKSCPDALLNKRGHKPELKTVLLLVVTQSRREYINCINLELNTSADHRMTRIVCTGVGKEKRSSELSDIPRSSNVTV